MTRHLIHIGYPKTGSTFLQRWFEKHPQLDYVEGGIAGFRNVYAVSDRHTAISSRYSVTSSETLSLPIGRRTRAGELFDDSRLQAAQRAVCTNLASLFPEARILIVTRGFRSMVLSGYSQYVRVGGTETLQDLIRHAGTQRPWDYDAMIKLYGDAFGADNLIVIPYELLRDDAERFIRTLEDRLGIDHAGTPQERLNPSLSAAELVWYPTLTRILERLPLGRLRRAYNRAIFGSRLRAPVALLQRLRPGAVPTAESIPEELMRSFRGHADSLREDPLYAPYADEYLF